MSAQYLNIDGFNRPGQGYSSDNPMFGFVWSGRQVDTRLLKGHLYNPDGSQFNWNNRWNNNPYWVATVNKNWDNRDRVIGSGSVTYQFTPRISAPWSGAGRIGTRTIAKRIFAAGTLGQSGVDENGAFGEGDVFRQETNTDFLVTATPSRMGDLTFTVNMGGQPARQRTTDPAMSTLGNLVIPGLYDLGNAAVTPDLGDWREQVRVNSLYGAAQIGYKDDLLLDLTGSKRLVFHPSGRTTTPTSTPPFPGA